METNHTRFLAAQSELEAILTAIMTQLTAANDFTQREMPRAIKLFEELRDMSLGSSSDK